MAISRVVLVFGVLLYLLLESQCVQLRPNVQEKKPQASNVNLYVSFHGGKKSSGEINNIYSYPLSGGGDGTPVLGKGGSLRELRCAAFRSDGSLLVNNAYKDDSRVVHYSACTGSGNRSYVSVFVAYDSSSNPGLDHPYAIAIDHSGNVYVSNQDSNSVTRYSIYGNPLPLPPALGNGDYNPGTFVQYDPSSNGIRGIAFDATGTLWVASEDTNQVTGYNPSGYSTVNISVSGPVGLFFEKATNLLYIGSKSSNTVTAYNTATGRMSSLQFSDPKLSHPAGIAVDTPSSSLYVVSQDHNAVIKFDSQTGQSYGEFISDMPDSPECLLLSPC